MGLFGTTNLFSYVDDNPLAFDDQFGLLWGGQAEAAIEVGSMWFWYQEMKQRNFIGADKYYHCMAHCSVVGIAPSGILMSLIIGYGREVIDFPKNIVKKSPKTSRGMPPLDSLKDRVEDLDANEWGRYAPPGVPCTDWCKALAPKGFTP